MESKGLLHSSGWPLADFLASPLASKAQLGIVSRANVASACFVTIQLTQDADIAIAKAAIAAVPQITAKVAALALAVAVDPAGSQDTVDLNPCRLSSVVGVEPGRWLQWHNNANHEQQQPRFASFQPVWNKDHTAIIFPKSDTDIILFFKAERFDICFEAARQTLRLMKPCIKDAQHIMGFRYLGGKDLTGFIDGSRNSDNRLRGAASTSLIQDDPVHFAGSFLYAARFVHDLDTFFDLDDTQKSELLGRQYGVEKPATLAYAIDNRIENPFVECEPEDCHIQRATGSMYRQSFPYMTERENGLQFVAFSKDPHVFSKVLHSMAGHIGFGSHDKLLTITRAVSGNIYYCPSLQELEQLTQSEMSLKGLSLAPA